VAEGGGLLNRYTLQRRIEGSNPSVSARSWKCGTESLSGRVSQNLIRAPGALPILDRGIAKACRTRRNAE